MEFLAWCGVVLGGIFVLVGFSGFSSNPYGFGGGINPKVFFIVPGLVLLVYGLLSVVIVQMARAQVDTAELTGQALKVARDQLEVSKQSLRQSEALQRGFEALKTIEPDTTKADFGALKEKSGATAKEPRPREGKPELKHEIGAAIEYRTKTIRVAADGYQFAGQSYPTLEEAQARVDEGGFTLPPAEAVEPERPTLSPAGYPMDWKSDTVLGYRSEVVELRDGHFHYAGLSFADTEHVCRYIDQRVDRGRLVAPPRPPR